MKTSSKCISCFLRQADVTASLIKLTKSKRKELFSILTKKLLTFDFDQPPVVFGRTIYRSISKVSGVKDIFLKEKLRIENYLIKSADEIERLFKTGGNFLHTTARMSCAANAIDFGVGKIPELDKLIEELKRAKLRIDHFNIFINKLDTAKNVLIVGDNCGEAFFDKFFIKAILKDNPRIKIFYAVRSAPIINDILISDAKRVGLHAVAKVFSSGCDYPGLILSKTSDYFKKVYKNADFVISKGQGNFEAFRGDKDIFYLFKSKCPAVSEFLSLPINSLLFIHNKCIF